MFESIAETGRNRALATNYDFIVCGSGSAGSVVARRLAENANVSVLLLEAGGNDDCLAVMDPSQWPSNIGSDRDWGFTAEPNQQLNGRAIPMSMGKVLGGGSSINALTWARGNQSDWDFFASEAGDPAWNYESVLRIYHRIEDWHGAPDPKYRGTGGPHFVQPPPNPHPLAPAMIEALGSIGFPIFENANGRIHESAVGGASINDVITQNGKRQSAFRSYVVPYLGSPNLTIVTRALVTRITFERQAATGVDIFYDGKLHHIGATREVILSLGAINTPKVLMQSGIGDESELRRFGIPVVQHLPGVGQNLQDHTGLQCVWEYQVAEPPRNTTSEAIFYWRSNSELPGPDVFTIVAERQFASAENELKFTMPEAGWTLFSGLARPKSRGQIRLTGPGVLDPVKIEANMLADADDFKTALACIEMCREVGNSAAIKPFAKREVMPGNLKGTELENYVRNAAVTYWHQTCTAKMGQDAMSVVDSNLKVYGVEKLRIADGSIMPRVSSGTTMAPCFVIGERASEILQAQYTD